MTERLSRLGAGLQPDTLENPWEEGILRRVTNTMEVTLPWASWFASVCRSMKG